MNFLEIGTCDLLGNPWRMESRIRYTYPVTGFSSFRREPARNKHSLTPDTDAVFLLPNPVISRGFLTGTGDFPGGSYLKLLEQASGIIDLEHVSSYLIMIPPSFLD
jgi:hypothetical protein